jgi:hypothetical protein
MTIGDLLVGEKVRREKRWTSASETPARELVRYDRPGMSKSEPDGAFPAPEHPSRRALQSHFAALYSCWTHDLVVPFDAVEYQNLLLNHRILSLSAFRQSVPEGTLVTTPNSGHYIQLDEPGLVTGAIQRVLGALTKRR